MLLLVVRAVCALSAFVVCCPYSRCQNAVIDKPSDRSQADRDMGSTRTVERSIELGPYVVRIAEDAGPRILGFARTGGPDLFASLPDAVIDVPGLETFHFLGGHRLWSAPEVPQTTYQPDDSDVEIAFDGEIVRVSAKPDGSGLAKRISLVHRDGKVIVDHELTNAGTEPVYVAPWAITQFAPGGVAYLPHSQETADPFGVLPNRSLVVWPYTDLGAPEISFGLRFTAVSASSRSEKMKIGLRNSLGWLAYSAHGEIFVKWSAVHDDGSPYVDSDASVQCYRDERFLELETLGPLTTLDPGGTVSHRETWATLSTEGDDIEEFLARLEPDPVTMLP